MLLCFVFASKRSDSFSDSNWYRIHIGWADVNACRAIKTIGKRQEIDHWELTGVSLNGLIPDYLNPFLPNLVNRGSENNPFKFKRLYSQRFRVAEFPALFQFRMVSPRVVM